MQTQAKFHHQFISPLLSSVSKQSQRNLQNNVNNFVTRFGRFVTRTSITVVLGLTVINSRQLAIFLTAKRANKKPLELRQRVFLSFYSQIKISSTCIC